MGWMRWPIMALMLMCLVAGRANAGEGASEQRTRVGSGPREVPLYEGKREAIDRVVGTYIAGRHLEGGFAREFDLEEGPATFVLVVYGQGMDCMSGCIFSNLCAVVDGGGVHPYAFDFVSEEENVLGISWRREPGEPFNSRLYRGGGLDGRKHGLVKSGEFRTFEEEARSGKNRFSRCFPVPGF